MEIRTLGFRGEALPSIAAVSRLVVETAVEGDDPGTRVRALAGRIQSVEDAARRRGTTVDVRNLFLNTPVRARFLRNVGLETRAVAETLHALSLANLGVRFVFETNGRPQLDLPADRPLEERIAEIWEDAGLVPLSARRGGLGLDGAVQRARQGALRLPPNPALRERPPLPRRTGRGRGGPGLPHHRGRGGPGLALRLPDRAPGPSGRERAPRQGGSALPGLGRGRGVRGGVGAEGAGGRRLRRRVGQAAAGPAGFAKVRPAVAARAGTAPPAGARFGSSATRTPRTSRTPRTTLARNSPRSPRRAASLPRLPSPPSSRSTTASSWPRPATA